MGKSQRGAARPFAVGGLSRETLATLVVAVIAFALILTSVWTERNVAADQPEPVVNFARLVKVLACFAAAALFRSCLPPVRRLFAVGCLCMVVYLVLYAVGLVLPGDAPEYMPVAYLSALFGGAGDACLILLAAHVVATYPPRVSSVAVPAVYLLNEVLYFALAYATTPVLVLVRPLFKVAAAALVAICLVRAGRTVPAEPSGVHPVQYGLAVPRSGRERALEFLGSSREWALLLIGTTLFPFVFGVVSQLGSGDLPGLYDASSELGAIGVLALLVVFGALWGTRFTYDGVLGLSIPVYATGCLLLPLLGGSDSAAGMLVKFGYTAYQVMFWMLLTRRAYEDPRHSYLYFGVFYGIFEGATLVARAGVAALLPLAADSARAVWIAALVSLWLIGLYGLLFFLTSERHPSRCRPLSTGGFGEDGSSTVGPVRAGASLSGGDGRASPADTGSTAVSADDGFAAFCEAYGLSAREREVLAEAVHGFSMENIGTKLYITKDTVKTHLVRIYRKAGVSGKQELMALVDDFVRGR